MIGDLVITTASDSEFLNTITPNYREEKSGWEIIAGDRIVVDDYLEADGDEYSSEITYDFQTNKTTIQQLSAYEIVNSREQMIAEGAFKPRLLAVNIGDAITLSISEISSGKFIVVDREFNAQTATVSLKFRSENDEKHAFALGQTSIPPVDRVVQPPWFSVMAAPVSGSWSAFADSVDGGDGVTSLPVIAVGRLLEDNALASEHIIEYKQTSSSDWIFWGAYPTGQNRIVITGVAPQSSYDVRVRYRNKYGAESTGLGFTITTDPLNVPGAGDVDWSSLEGVPANLASLVGNEALKNSDVSTRSVFPDSDYKDPT
ncbi:MAG: hypothetical protein B7Z26_10575, partial [Asticcacaulis sp. 32-58-5]